MSPIRKVCVAMVCALTLIACGSPSLGEAPAPVPQSTADTTAPNSTDSGSSVTISAEPSPNPTKTAPPAPPQSPKVLLTKENQGLKIKLIEQERCTKTGGFLTIDGSGFTPGVPRWTHATTPTGEIYDAAPIRNPGRVANNGSISSWQWPCGGDDPGTYTLSIVDLGPTEHRIISFQVTVHES